MFPVLNIISRVYRCVYRPSVLLLIASGLPMVALIGVFLAISAAGWRAGGDTSLIFSSRIPSRLCRSPNTFLDEELYPVALTITLFFNGMKKLPSVSEKLDSKLLIILLQTIVHYFPQNYCPHLRLRLLLRKDKTPQLLTLSYLQEPGREQVI